MVSSTSNIEYQAKSIETKWQDLWDKSDIYKFDESGDPDNRFYSLVMFPYPSGNLHMGHMRVYTISDVISRYQRMLGRNVLNPMGFDAFGLPAENAAIERGVHPAEWTDSNIAHMRDEQLKRMGTSYDWEREVISCHEDYYHWTQYLFLKLYDKGLAYQKEAPVNWCSKCNTVLANEQVEDGKCWRHSDTQVHKRMMKQWFLRITDYAEELLNDLDKLEDWPNSVKIMQQNWIGKSHGAEISFPVCEAPGSRLPAPGNSIKVYTTRPDTVMGVTYMVLAPEHKLVQELTSPENKEAVAKYIKEAASKNEIERTAEGRKKTGVFIGSYCLNPYTQEKIPIWIADYALVDYGTGAVMAVPAHDQRDYEFAQEFSLPIRIVIATKDDPQVIAEQEAQNCAYIEPGILVNSGQFNSIDNEEAKKTIVDWGAKNNNPEINSGKAFAQAVINYRLRDWLISRQRYWGCPIPLLETEDGEIVPVAYEDLPVKLPLDIDFAAAKEQGGSVLENNPDWYKVTLKDGRKAKRITDTMDTFICSSWYFMRYPDASNLEKPFAKDKVFPVNQYVGGIEHAILHLLYARFFTKALRDCDMLSYDEPFTSLLSQGMVVKYSEKDGKIAKMSKSKGNVVGTNEFFDQYGADAARLFILFAAPAEAEVEWTDDGAQGQHRFINRVWRLYQSLLQAIGSRLQASKDDNLNLDINSLSPENAGILRAYHSALKSITEDLDPKHNQFNTAIARMAEFINAMYKYQLIKGEQEESRAYSDEDIQVLRHCLYNFIKVLAPFTPHLAEELWFSIVLNKEANASNIATDSIHKQSWPKYNPQYIEANTFNLVIQFKGKKVDVVEVSKDLSKEDLEKTALANEKLLKKIEGLDIKKVIVVPNKLVNVVAV